METILNHILQISNYPSESEKLTVEDIYTIVHNNTMTVKTFAIAYHDQFEPQNVINQKALEVLRPIVIDHLLPLWTRVSKSFEEEDVNRVFFKIIENKRKKWKDHLGKDEEKAKKKAQRGRKSTVRSILGT